MKDKSLAKDKHLAEQLLNMCRWGKRGGEGGEKRRVSRLDPDVVRRECCRSALL